MKVLCQSCITKFWTDKFWTLPGFPQVQVIKSQQGKPVIAYYRPLPSPKAKLNYIFSTHSTHWSMSFVGHAVPLRCHRQTGYQSTLRAVLGGSSTSKMSWSATSSVSLYTFFLPFDLRVPVATVVAVFNASETAARNEWSLNELERLECWTVVHAREDSHGISRFVWVHLKIESTSPHRLAPNLRCRWKVRMI